MTESRQLTILLMVAGMGGLVYLLLPVLQPFVVAALLAYCANPLVSRLSRLGLSRFFAALLTLLMVLGLGMLVLVLVVPMVEQQVSAFIKKWPAYVDWVQGSAWPWLQARFGMFDYQLDLNVFKQIFVDHWQKVGGAAAMVANAVSNSGLMLLALVTNLLLIPVVTFYLLRDWPFLIERVQWLLPRDTAPTIKALANDCDEVLATFFRGQLSVMMALAAVYSVGLWLAGIDLALLIGLVAGVVSFVPYLGLVIGVVVAGIASVVQFHDLSHLLPVIAVFGVGQILEGVVLTPVLVGERIGLHPVVVILAVMVGGQLFGFVGVLLALPVAAVAAVLLRRAGTHYVESDLYQGEDRTPE